MSDKKIEIAGKKLMVYTELLRNLVILLIAVGEGSISLLFKLSNPVSIPLLILGFNLRVDFRNCEVGYLYKISVEGAPVMGKEVLIATVVAVLLGIAFLIAIYSIAWIATESKKS